MENKKIIAKYGVAGKDALQTLTWACLLIGGVLWLWGAAWVLNVPQLPDGDLTAISEFTTLYGSQRQHHVRVAPWWNLAGALLGWGLISLLLDTTLEGRMANGAWRIARQVTISLCLLMGLGWAVYQTAGWHGTLFLAPGSPAQLITPDLNVTFDRFLIPPAPTGPGRALALRLEVAGQPYEIRETQPYRQDGWILTPRWYGAVIQGAELAHPVFVGQSGPVALPFTDGRTLTINADIENLTLPSNALRSLTITHTAIIEAHYIPFWP